jgi:hypothetical protein
MHDLIVFAGVSGCLEFAECIHGQLPAEHRLVEFHRLAGIIFETYIGVKFASHLTSELSV